MPLLERDALVHHARDLGDIRAAYGRRAIGDPTDVVPAELGKFLVELPEQVRVLHDGNHLLLHVVERGEVGGVPGQVLGGLQGCDRELAGKHGLAQLECSVRQGRILLRSILRCHRVR